MKAQSQLRMRTSGLSYLRSVSVRLLKKQLVILDRSNKKTANEPGSRRHNRNMSLERMVLVLVPGPHR